jgi:hypothetical protein
MEYSNQADGEKIEGVWKITMDLEPGTYEYKIYGGR